MSLFSALPKQPSECFRTLESLAEAHGVPIPRAFEIAKSHVSEIIADYLPAEPHAAIEPASYARQWQLSYHTVVELLNNNPSVARTPEREYYFDISKCLCSYEDGEDRD
jgi:hypothetical protein